MLNKKASNLYGTPSPDIDWSASVTDLVGNVYTTGHSLISANNVELLLTKHNSLGNLVWETTYSAGADTKSYGLAIALDNTGDIIIAGATNSLFSADNDNLILKYSPTGVLLWDQTYDGPDGGEDVPAAIITDTQNNIYITGASYDDTDDYDYLTLKL